MAPSPDVAWIRSAIERYQAPLLRFATAIAGAGLADDVVQDTFMRLVAARREDIEDHLSAWLFTVCKNRALELRRSLSREVGIEESPDMETSQPTQEEALARSDEASRVMRLVGELSERHQEVVALRFAAGLSYREIAGVTGLTETNVGFILHTALRALKKRLDEIDSSRAPRRES